MQSNKDYQEFRASVLKLKDSRIHKITGSIGVYDAYKWLRKNKWLNIPRPLTEHEFYTIIRKVNNYLAEELLNGNDVELPCRMGKLEIRKTPARVNFTEDKLVTNLPIDWDSTLKLWFEDEEAYNKKMLLYEDNKETFKVIYNTYNANYNNKSFYIFKLNRDIKTGLKKKIKDKALDAFIIR